MAGNGSVAVKPHQHSERRGGTLLSTVARDSGAPAEAAKGRTVKVKDVEELIKEIHGVTDCRIVINDWGAVDEVHVLASAERTAKGIARDVESALAARFGMDVDHKKISVAQLGTPSPIPPAEYRLRIKGHRIEVDQTARTATIKVDLLTPIGTVVSGEAMGPQERRTLLRMAAQATIEALATLLPHPKQLNVEDVIQTHVGGREIILAVLAVQGSRVDDVLVGTASVVPGEDVASAVRACLDAVNRRLSLFINQA